MGLRQQARAGMVYAPGLTYVPSGPASAGAAAAVLAPPPAPPAPAAAAAAVAAPAAPAVAVVAPPPRPASPKAAPAAPEQRTLLSMEDDEMSPEQIQCRCRGRLGSCREAALGEPGCAIRAAPSGRHHALIRRGVGYMRTRHGSPRPKPLYAVGVDQPPLHPCSAVR
jgi:hypothetical protein